MIRKFNKSKQNGFTLIELMVVMVIIVVAIAAIVNRRASANQTSMVNNEGNNLQAIVSKVTSSFAARPNYTGATTALMLAQNGFPANMVNGAVVSNSWQGAVTVAPNATPTTFDITYAGVPTAACIELVSNVSQSYNEVTVGTTKTKNGAQTADLNTTQTACGAAAAVSITFNHS